MQDAFFEKGWIKFPFDAVLKSWVDHARPHAIDTLSNPQFAQWWRHGGTWFAGVNALGNNVKGQLPDGPPLAGKPIEFVTRELGFHGPWDYAQISVCKPGYPQFDGSESEASFRYRTKRDAAHVDGLHLDNGRRYPREFHAFILGIPMTEVTLFNSPVVVWEGSQTIMCDALKNALEPKISGDWGQVDVTEIYQATRKKIFDSCRRINITAVPGEAYLIHRLALHGISPWQGKRNSKHRMVCYFRPALTDRRAWLNA